MKTATNAIGLLKSQKTVYCTICSSSYTRKSQELIYSKEEIENAKEKLTLKLNAEYTCKVCKSILNS
jgi:hypothetical protein